MQLKKTDKIISFIDGIIVLLNIAVARGCFLLYWAFKESRVAALTGYVIIIDTLFLLLRFRKKLVFDRKFAIPLFFYFCIHLINLVSVLLKGLGNYTFFLELLVLISLFVLILCELTSTYLPIYRDLSIKQISKGYVWLSMISVFGVLLSFFLIRTLGVRWKVVDVDFLASNMERGAEYYLSYFSLLMSEGTIRVPYFQDFGILTGMYHEPHSFAWLVFPSLILLLGFLEKNISKVLLIIVAILCVLFEGSATNIIVLFVCLTIFFFLNFRKNVFSTIFGIAVIVLFIYIYISTDQTFLDFLQGRLDEENSSQQYSRSLLQFAFSPRTLLGSNILISEGGVDLMQNTLSSSDVGFLAFICNIGFIIAYSVNMIKLLLSDWKMAKAVGFASLYFILHSAKMGLLMYYQTLPILLVFLQYLALNKYGRVKTSEQPA